MEKVFAHGTIRAKIQSAVIMNYGIPVFQFPLSTNPFGIEQVPKVLGNKKCGEIDIVHLVILECEGMSD